MNFESSNLVPLQQASLCLDCDVISTECTRCAACGSQALLSIARALSRPEYSGVLRPERNLLMAGPPRRSANFLHST